MTSNDLVYTNATPERAADIVALEHLALSNLADHDLLTERGVILQTELFPEGGFMVLDGDKVVGIGLGIFVDYDISEPQHDLHEVAGEEGFGNHDPDGDWYYGIDIAVHPDYRGRGIARRLYELRKEVVIDHNRKGFIAGGVLPGFVDHKHEMTAQEYVDAVVAGELFDPTLSVQLRNGFEVLGVIADYVEDPTTDNWASFLLWRNPHYDPDKA